MGTNHGGGGVNFGRRLPPIGGQYSTPINNLGALDFGGKRDFVTPHAQMPGQDAADRAVVDDACTRKLREG